MSLAAFTFTDRARPIVELGTGDTRMPTGQATWDTARWDTAPAATWAGTEPTWRDVTCDVFAYRTEYGRRRITDRFVVGLASVVVNNATGWADSNATVDPGVLGVRPGRAIRVGIVHAVYGVRWLFRGFVDAMTPTYVPGEPDAVELACIDALGEVNRAKLRPAPDAFAPGDTVTQRIARLLDLAEWSSTKRDLWLTADTLVADTMGGQLADLLGQAADSGGGSVFGDLEARVAYRPRDWQTFVPGTPPDATIGNVEMGHTIPGTPAVPGYLTPIVGTVTTPDPGVLPAQFTIVAKIRPTVPAPAFGVIAGQFENPYTWLLRLQSNGNLYWNADLSKQAAVAGSPLTATDRHIALAVNTAADLTAFTSADGQVWTQTGRNILVAAPPDTTTIMRIGNGTGVGQPFDGRIYSVEMRTGLDPAAGTVVWRFDADDYPGTGTSYVDPRGRTWTLTNAAAITPKIPAGPDVVVPADVCPTRWERPFARADIATRVIIGRNLETAIVLDDDPAQLLYGIEPFERTDLLTESDARLQQLGERILRTRAASSAPRIRSVSLDARTAENALDLMTTVDVYRPSRYRCRLEYPRGTVFDAEHFATGVVHEVTPKAWTLDLNLDLAAPFAAAGGRWDGARWNQSTWTNAARLRVEALALLEEIHS